MSDVAAIEVVRAERRVRFRREWIVGASLAAAAILVAAISLGVGGYTLSVPDLLATLVGQGSTKDEFVVLQLRLPRVTMAIVVGIAFAVAGALFQSLFANPLASPDIIGITAGASASAVAALLVFGLSGFAVSAWAFVGALVVAGSIYLLSSSAGLHGYRFVLVGIAVAFLVEAVLGYLLTRADVRDAQGALVWLVGSLSGVRWVDIAIAAGGVAVLLPVVAVLAPRLRALQLGEQSAAGLGVVVQPTRLALLFAAVGLAAIGTAAVGPVAFVAFVAGPIARRLVRSGGLALVHSALVGVLLVLASDFVAQHLLGGTQVPVGIVTGAVGAPYLLWILARSNRTRGES